MMETGGVDHCPDEEKILEIPAPQESPLPPLPASNVCFEQPFSSFMDRLDPLIYPTALFCKEDEDKKNRKKLFHFKLPVKTLNEFTSGWHMRPRPKQRILLTFEYWRINPSADQWKEMRKHLRKHAHISINGHSVSLKKAPNPVDVTAYCLSDRPEENNHRLESAWTGDICDFAIKLLIVNHASVDSLAKSISEDAEYQRASEVTRETVIVRMLSDDLAVDQMKVTLLCPLGKNRIRVPARCRSCTHLECFDLTNFLSFNDNEAAKWKCPICLAPALANLIIDGYFKQVLHNTAAETTEVVIRIDGTWQEPALPPVDVIELDSDDEVDTAQNAIFPRELSVEPID